MKKIKNKDMSAYAGVFNRGWGDECLYIRLHYDFWSSGTLMAPVIEVNVTDRLGEYMKVNLYYVKNQAEIAKMVETTQQTISRWIKKNLLINEKIQSGMRIKNIQIE